jgi:hypothetical protein
MSEYKPTCLVCGTAFQASRRDAKTCSKRCRNALRSGAELRSMGKADVLTSLPQQAGSQTGSDALYRGRLDRADMLVVDRYGQIVSGYLTGRTLREVLQTAAREGWLAYRHRPDGWYSAEWADGRIALCGPAKGLPGAALAETMGEGVAA